MKRIILVFLVCSLICTALASFSFVYASEIQYSGGSGTEDDPFLISTASDINELNSNISNDPSLWYTQYYYKLTCDIVVPCSVGPVFTHGSYKHTLVDADYSLGKQVMLYGWYDEYGYMWNEDGYRDEIYYGPFITHESSLFVPTRYFAGGEIVFEPRNSYKFIGIKRSAAFTGVFDGDGHALIAPDTDTGEDFYLFGALENGAVVKNLRIEGENSIIAFYSDESSTIESCCVIDSQRYMIDENYGTIRACANLSPDLADPVRDRSYMRGSISDFLDLTGKDFRYFRYAKEYYNNYTYYRCVSLHKDSDDTGTPTRNKYYSLAECLANGGKISKYAGFDFENTWSMICGVPVLRCLGRLVGGDVNLDGHLDARDSYLLRMFMVDEMVYNDYTNIAVSDLNGDGVINAVDSALMKRKLV